MIRTIISNNFRRATKRSSVIANSQICKFSEDSAAAAAKTSKFTKEIELNFPDVAGKGLIHWEKSEGDIINRGDLICNVELQDFTFGMDSDDDTATMMGKMYVDEGEEVQPGTPICVILHPEDEEEILTEDISK